MAGWGIAEGLNQGVSNYLQMQQLGRQRALEDAERKRQDEDRKRAIFLQNSQWLGQLDQPSRDAVLARNPDVFDPDFIPKSYQASSGGTAGLLASNGMDIAGPPAPGFTIRTTDDVARDLQNKVANLQLTNLQDEQTYQDADKAWQLGDDRLLNNIPDERRRPWMRGLGSDYFANRKLKDMKPQIVAVIQAAMANARPGQESAVQASTIAGLDAAYGKGWRDVTGVGQPQLEGPSAALLAPEPADPTQNPMLGVASDFAQNPALAELLFPQQPYDERQPTRIVDPALANPLFAALPQTAEDKLARLTPVLQAMAGIDALHKSGVSPEDTYVTRQVPWQAMQDLGLIPKDKAFRGDFMKTGVLTPQEEMAQNNAATKMAIDAGNQNWDRQMDLARLGVSQDNLALARERENRLASQPTKGADPNKRIYSVGNDMAKTLLGFGYNPSVSGVEARNNFQAMERKGWIYMDPISKTYKPVVKREQGKGGKPGKVVKNYTNSVMHEIQVINDKYKKLSVATPSPRADGTAQVLGYNVVGIGSNTPVHYGSHAAGDTFDVTENEARRKGKSLEQIAKEFAAQGYVVAVRKKGQRGISSNHLHITQPGTVEAKRIAGQQGVMQPASAKTAYSAPSQAGVDADIKKILKKYPQATDAQILQAMADSYGLKPGDFKGAVGRVRKAAKHA